MTPLSVRDHPNHERPLNGGLWGGRRGFLQEAGGAGFEKVSMAGAAVERVLEQVQTLTLTLVLGEHGAAGERVLEQGELRC